MSDLLWQQFIYAPHNFQITLHCGKVLYSMINELAVILCTKADNSNTNVCA